MNWQEQIHILSDTATVFNISVQPERSRRQGRKMLFLRAKESRSSFFCTFAASFIDS
jgi:hypothetical protein